MSLLSGLSGIGGVEWRRASEKEGTGELLRLSAKMAVELGELVCLQFMLVSAPKRQEEKRRRKHGGVCRLNSALLLSILCVDPLQNESLLVNEAPLDFNPLQL